MTPTENNDDGTDNGMAEAGPVAEHSLTSEQKAQDILASARAEADAILSRARAAAAEVSGATAQREGQSPATAASEQVLAKARAAVSEIRAKAAGLTGEVHDKVYASADAVLEYARSTAREFRERGPRQRQRLWHGRDRWRNRSLPRLAQRWEKSTRTETGQCRVPGATTPARRRRGGVSGLLVTSGGQCVTGAT